MSATRAVLLCLLVLAGLVGVGARDALAEDPCAPKRKPVCVEKEVVIPAVTQTVRLPVYERVELPVMVKRRKPLYREVPFPVYGARLVPYYGVRRTPIYEDAEVPAFAWRAVPVLGSRCVPVYRDCEVPVYRARQVPITKEVCDPGTGEMRTVECGTRCENVEIGRKTVRCLTGWEREAYSCGTRREQVRSGTRTIRRRVGWKKQRVCIGARREVFPVYTETRRVRSGFETELVQTGTRCVVRFKGWRDEVQVVCPERTETVREVVMVPVEVVSVEAVAPTR